MRYVIKMIYLSVMVMAVCGVSQLAVAQPPSFMKEQAHNQRGFMTVQDNNRGKAMRKRFKNLPPEKQQELQQRRQQIHQELMALSPEERASRLKEMRKNMLEKNKERRQERMERMDERWQGASDEERRVFCDKVREKCAAEGGFVCDTAKVRCAGQ